MSLWKRCLTMLLLPIALGGLAKAQTAPGSAAAPRFVRAAGSASIAVKPDQAEINIGVVTEAKTAKAAAAANASESAKVIEQLKKAAGPGAEIRTVNYTVYPRFRHDEQGRDPQIIGFTASNMVQIKVNDIDKVGGLIDTATGSGANQIHGIQFGLRDEQAARARALQQATEKAKASAEAMAAAIGATLGKVRSVEEQGSNPIQPLRAMAMAEASVAATPVEPGTIEVTASVIITMEME